MNILHLTLKKEWFDMILSGEKKEEYRKIKPHWIKRLVWLKEEEIFDCIIDVLENCPEDFESDDAGFRHYDAVLFRNGYSKNAPEMLVNIHSICSDFGVSEWGGNPNKRTFVLKLGNILNTKNIEWFKYK